MNAKKITAVFLILFVVASVGTIVAKEKNAQPTAPTAGQPVCDEPIAEKRLELDPSALTCIACAEKA